MGGEEYLLLYESAKQSAATEESRSVIGKGSDPTGRTFLVLLELGGMGSASSLDWATIGAFSSPL